MNEQAINEAAERYADNYKRWSEELLPSTNKQAAISHRRWLDESILADWAASHIAAQREAEESGKLPIDEAWLLANGINEYRAWYTADSCCRFKWEDGRAYFEVSYRASGDSFKFKLRLTTRAQLTALLSALGGTK